MNTLPATSFLLPDASLLVLCRRLATRPAGKVDNKLQLPLTHTHKVFRLKCKERVKDCSGSSVRFT